MVVVVALLTSWFTAFDVLPAKFESPLYTAVIDFVPTPSADIEKVAVPPLNVPVPSTVAP